MIIKDDDNNNDNANNDNGDQTIIIFQIRHFREPIVREKRGFRLLLMCRCIVIDVLMLQYY